MKTPFRLTREEKRNWLVHKKISPGFDWQAYIAVKPELEARVTEMMRSARTEEEQEALRLWQEYLRSNDLPAIRRALVGLEEKDIQLRATSPFPGLFRP